METGQATTAGAELTARLGISEAGTYRVIWKVVSQDSHPARGEFEFSVGSRGRVAPSPSEGVELGAVSPGGLALAVLARWIHFAGLALAAGAVLLLSLRAAPEDPVRRAAAIGVVLLVLAEPVAMVAEVVSLGPLDLTSTGDVLGSGFGRLAGLRLGCALALWMVLGAVRAAGRGIPLVVLPVAALLLVDGFSVHLVLGGQPAAILLGAVHEGAMAVWLGALVILLVLQRPLRPLARVAAACLGLLVVSGAALAALHLSRPADLLFSPYGLVLAAKMLLVAAVIAVARLGSRRLEVAAIAGVAALGGLLLSLPPPR